MSAKYLKNISLNYIIHKYAYVKLSCGEGQGVVYGSGKGGGGGGGSDSEVFCLKGTELDYGMKVIFREG